MDNLPIDMSHPQVQDYLSLVRLQVLTPLSLLINIAAVLVCALIVRPSIGGVSKLNPTSLSPNPALIAIYVVAIYVGQIGYCILLVLAGKSETKRALTKGVGLSLVFANWVMAGWAVTWVFQWFLVSTILQGVLLLLLLYSNIALMVYHPPTSSRPIDTALIHAPLRFFLILPLSVLFPYSLFVTLGLVYKHLDPDQPVLWSANHAWAGFGVVLGTNLLGLLVVVLRRDIVWCVAATWICASMWSQDPKPVQVFITVIIFTVLHPLGLIASLMYSKFYKQEGRVVLPGNDHPALYNGTPRRAADEEENDVGPREIDDGNWP